MTPEEQAAMEKMRADRDREASAKLGEILLPHQIKRLNEIYVQQAGTAALQDEEIAKLLGISDAQKAKLAEVSLQNRESIGAAVREMFHSRPRSRGSRPGRPAIAPGHPARGRPDPLSPRRRAAGATPRPG